MKKWFYNLPVKALCVILCTLCLFCTAFSAVGMVCLLIEDGYRLNWEEMREKVLEERYDYYPQMIADNYDLSVYNDFDFYQWLDGMQSDENFWCTVYKENGIIAFSDYAGEEYTANISRRIYVSRMVWNSGSGGYEVENVSYDVTVYIPSPSPGSNLETVLEILKFFWSMRYGLIATLSACGVGFLVLCIFLCCAAGRRSEGEPKTGFFNRIPLEVWLLAGFFAFLAEWWFVEQFPAQLWFIFLCVCVFFLLDALLLILFMMTLAVRIKTDTFVSSSLVGRFCLFLKRTRHVFQRLWEDIRLEPKVALVLGGLAIFDLILATMLEFTEYLAALLIEGLVLAGVLIWYAAAVQRLHQDLTHLAEGKLDHRSDLSRLPPGLRSFGEDMNRSAEGMEKAVEEKLKSERFKTELITNVSHDIKTPLTSIVNYVDLMKKEDVENDRIREYLEVLDRQSTRLKKLIEDLVESSKAASGVLSVELSKCDAKVLLEQAMGEYQAALEERGLIPCLQLPEEPVYIMADGRRLWRVMDNLFSNIKKYALSGTRVYVSLEEGEGKVHLIFRNISAEPIRVSGEHLSERFVRGDLSRNTEGSGLGLAIAQSLVELQKGNLSVTVDGDLFKAVVSFDRIF